MKQIAPPTPTPMPILAGVVRFLDVDAVGNDGDVDVASDDVEAGDGRGLVL
jgi:hypothetical protein